MITAGKISVLLRFVFMVFVTPNSEVDFVKLQRYCQPHLLYTRVEGECQ